MRRTSFSGSIQPPYHILFKYDFLGHTEYVNGTKTGHWFNKEKLLVISVPEGASTVRIAHEETFSVLLGKLLSVSGVVLTAAILVPSPKKDSNKNKKSTRKRS